MVEQERAMGQRLRLQAVLKYFGQLSLVLVILPFTPLRGTIEVMVGKTFISILPGYGCNVPAVMGTRILTSSDCPL